MPRYILIDNHSGFIFGDTADLPKVFIKTSDGEPMLQSNINSMTDAARWVDEVIAAPFRNYEELGHDPPDTSTGYHVYRADIDGSDAVAVVHDGQDQETIEAVQRSCRYEGFVRVTHPD